MQNTKQCRDLEAEGRELLARHTREIRAVFRRHSKERAALEAVGSGFPNRSANEAPAPPNTPGRLDTNESTAGYPVDAPIELTGRMREVLILVAEGRSNKEIAAILGLTVKTIETHRMHMMARLDLHDVASVVRYAIRYEYITL